MQAVPGLQQGRAPSGEAKGGDTEGVQGRILPAPWEIAGGLESRCLDPHPLVHNKDPPVFHSLAPGTVFCWCEVVFPELSEVAHLCSALRGGRRQLRCKRKFCRAGGKVKGEVAAAPLPWSCMWKNLFADCMKY